MAVAALGVALIVPEESPEPVVIVPEDPVSPEPVVIVPEDVEAALGLERSAVRAIQEGLAAAGFDPGGADGVFGAGTRSALRAWQAQQGVAGTGYLTAPSAAELRAAGEAVLAARASRVEPEPAPPPAGATREFDGMEFAWVPAGSL